MDRETLIHIWGFAKWIQAEEFKIITFLVQDARLCQER